MAGHTLDPGNLGDHVDRLYRAAWAMSGSPLDAEDLVQETFARVLAKPRRIHNGDDIGYLLQALRNVFTDSQRRRARRLAPESLDELSSVPDPSSATTPAEAAEARQVFALIAGLPSPLRDTLVAVDVAGLSYSEAGELLDVKEATITSRVFRARARVARAMQDSSDVVSTSEGTE